MEKLISEATQKRLDRYAQIKAKYNEYVKAGSPFTETAKQLTVDFKCSMSTIYKAVK